MFEAPKDPLNAKFQFAKLHLKEVAKDRYAEIVELANQLYRHSYVQQAKKFVTLAYIHLSNKNYHYYATVRANYRSLVNDYE